MSAVLRAEALALYRSVRWCRDESGLEAYAAAAVSGQRPEGFMAWVRDWFSGMPGCTHSDDLVYRQSDHTGMPSLVKIFEHWRAHPVEAGVLFGPRVGSVMGMSGQLCFGCVRPAPGLSTRDARIYPGDYERAHLQDSCLGGANDVNNLVPLCSECHWRMTANFSGCRMCAVRWVRWMNHSTTDDQT